MSWKSKHTRDRTHTTNMAAPPLIDDDITAVVEKEKQKSAVTVTITTGINIVRFIIFFSEQKVQYKFNAYKTSHFLDAYNLHEILFVFGSL